MAKSHIPVLSQELLEHLAVRPDGVYVDATCGLGGHTKQIAERLTSGFVIANDQDADSLELARLNTAEVADRIRFHHGRMSELEAALREMQVEKVRGLIADLGVSFYQLTEAERGFSLMADGPLDMRMNRTEGQTAADLVNFSSEKELADWIYQYGEERRSRRIARAIVRARPIRSTGHLARVIEEAVPRTGRLHPATQTFSAIRQVVNREMEELELFLEAIPRLVEPDGRVVMLTFHSLEDRRVKQSFQRLAREGRAQLLAKHVITPSDEETRENPAARSAKLRAIRLL